MRERTFPAGPDDADMAPVTLSTQSQIIAMLGQVVVGAPVCGLRSQGWALDLDGRITTILQTTAGGLDDAHQPSQAEAATALGLFLFWKNWASQPANKTAMVCAILRDSKALRLADTLVAPARR